MRHRRKTRTMVLGIHPVLWQRLRSLPVRSPAAIRSSHVRFAFRPTCTFIMGHNPLSAPIQTAARPSVRNKISRSMSGFTKIRGPIRARRIVVRASGRRETCVTMSVATLEISKCGSMIRSALLAAGLCTSVLAL